MHQKEYELGFEVHVYNPGTLEAGAGGSRACSQAVTHSEI